MKLSLIFLVCWCFLATTLGQNIFYYPYVPHGSVQYPADVASGRSSIRYLPQFYQRYVRPESSFVDFDDDDEEIYGRGNHQFRAEGNRNKLSSYKINQKKKVEDRYLAPVSRPINPVVSVVTVYGATTTIISTSFSSCIPKNQFNSPAAANGALSTTACRRKRDALEVLERIEPTSNIDQIETTPLIEEVLIRNQREVESSQDSWADLAAQLQPRFGFNLLNNYLISLLSSSVSTITQTITIPTSFALSTTTVPKTLLLLNQVPAPVNGAIANGVNCLPAGVGVCQ